MTSSSLSSSSYDVARFLLLLDAVDLDLVLRAEVNDEDAPRPLEDAVPVLRFDAVFLARPFFGGSSTNSTSSSESSSEPGLKSLSSLASSKVYLAFVAAVLLAGLATRDFFAVVVGSTSMWSSDRSSSSFEGSVFFLDLADDALLPLDADLEAFILVAFPRGFSPESSSLRPRSPFSISFSSSSSLSLPFFVCLEAPRFFFEADFPSSASSFSTAALALALSASFSRISFKAAVVLMEMEVSSPFFDLPRLMSWCVFFSRISSTVSPRADLCSLETKSSSAAPKLCSSRILSLSEVSRLSAMRSSTLMSASSSGSMGSSSDDFFALFAFFPSVLTVSVWRRR
mmetsp:Transcript_11968/g.25903  ORF Transcript_11968/g.25903 Transcript_11968/m.25903 type:complete len:342 (+) Transcript_11968:288-1313(+)